MNTKTYCSRPFDIRVLTQYGDWRPCCHTHTMMGFSEQAIVDLQKDLLNGIKNDHCKVCWDLESKGFDSHRRNEVSKSASVQSIEFNLSNLCNLKCRMCDSGSSSAWNPEHEYFVNNADTAYFFNTMPSGKLRPYKSKEKLVGALSAVDIDQLTKVSFYGGEPLLDFQVEDTLNYLYERVGSNLSIRVTTNLTELNEKIINSLKRFREVAIELSIEAVGESYSYIRGGKRYGIKEIEANLQYIQKNTNFEVGTGTCVGAYNIFSLGELCQWFSRSMIFSDKIGFFPIYRPDYLSCLSVPIEIRKKAFEKNCHDLAKKGLDSSLLVERIYSLLRLSTDHEPALLSKFIHYTEELDKFRGESFEKVFPEYSKLLHSSREN